MATILNNFLPLALIFLLVGARDDAFELLPTSDLIALLAGGKLYSGGPGAPDWVLLLYPVFPPPLGSWA
jgi:hypothetical protein